MYRPTYSRTYFSMIAASAFSVIGINANAQSSAEFYAGKTIVMQVGYGPGGGYDITTRLIAQFYGKNIPGSPRLIVQNVPGAGSMKLANSLFNNTPADGLTLGVFAFDVALEPFYGEKRALFDPAKFEWIGSMDTDIQFCAIWKGERVDVASFADLLKTKKEVTFGSSAPGAVPSVYPLFFKNALGARARLVHGYTGTKEIILAMQRGEVDASCGLFESVLQGAYRSEIDSGALNVLVQTSLDERSTHFPKAASIMDEIKSEEARGLARLVFGPASITRPLAAPPGTPSARVSVLRDALIATTKDQEARQAAEKIKMELKPKTAAEVEAMLKVFQSADPAELKKAFALTHE